MAMAEPSTPSASDPSYEELAKAWNSICQLLGADGPEEAVARVQTLTDQLDALDERGDIPDELITLSEFEQVLTRLHQKIADLRERNAELEDRLDALTKPEAEDTSGHALLDALNVTDYEAALDRIETFKQRISTLYQDREAIREAGHDDAESLIEAASALQRENERLRDNARNTSPDTEVLQSASAIRMVLGISNIDEAEEFVDRLDALSTSVRHALDHLGMNVPEELSVDRAENVASYLDVLAGQIDRLAEAPLPDDEMLEAAETLDAIETTLGIRSVEDAQEMEAMVRNLTEDLNELAHEQEILREEGLTAEDAVSMIRSMEEQLDDLYVHQDANQSNGTLPPGLQDALGVDSLEDAQRVVELTQEMDTQIATLFEDQEQLRKLGIDSIDEAIRMIQNMNEQLVELYEKVEARAAADASLPDAHQDTFQQLEALYARQEKLETELGVSDPEAIIEMVEDMTVQLETLYENRDATLSPDTASDDGPFPSDADLSEVERLETLIDNMAQQLDVLYQEKETLSEEGFDSADEATTRIINLREEIEALRARGAAAASDETDIDPEAAREWAALKDEFNIEHPGELRALLNGPADATPFPDDAPAQADAEGDHEEELAGAHEASPSDAEKPAPDAPDAPAPPEDTQPDPEWHAAPPLADAELRAALPTMSPEARNDLDLAAIQIDGDGQVVSLNDAAYALPLFDRLRSKSDALNTHFFFDLAPSAATDTFYGRFHAGLDRQHLDARFPHLFSAPTHPPFVALVHLYYDHDTATAWILLRTT